MINENSRQNRHDNGRPPTDWQLHQHSDSAWLPPELKAQKRWIGFATRWNSDKDKLDKKPAWLKNGEVCDLNATKPSNWWQYAPNRTGLVMEAEDNHIMIDYDAGVTDTTLAKWIADWILRAETLGYIESSISDPHGKHGKCHIPMFGIDRFPLETAEHRYGLRKNNIKCTALGVEIFNGAQGILMTGNGSRKGVLCGEPAQALMAELLDKITEVALDEFIYDREKLPPRKQKAATVAAKGNNAATNGLMAGDTAHTPLAEDKHDAEGVVAAFKEQGIPLCPDNDTFVEVCPKLCACVGVDRTHEILVNEEGYDKDAPKRIASFGKVAKGSQIAALVEYAKRRGVDLNNVPWACKKQSPPKLRPTEQSTNTGGCVAPTVDEAHDVLALVQAALKQNKKIIENNADFERVGHAVKWGLGAEKALQLCRQQGGKLDNIEKRISSFSCTTSQMGNLITHLLQKGVDIPFSALRTKMSVPSMRGMDIRVPVAVGRVAIDTVKKLDKEPVVKFLSSPGTVCGYCGPTGSMKTIFCLDRFKAAAKKYPDSINVYISDDMQIEEVKQYMQDFGIDLNRTLIYDLQEAINVDFAALLKQIHQDADNRVVKIVAIDPLLNICHKFWQSLNLDFVFNYTDRETAEVTFSQLLNPIAREFHCTLLALENTSRSIDSRDNWPGTPRWEGKMRACYRTYSHKSGQLQKIPKPIKEMMDMAGDDWIYAAAIKDRSVTDADFLFKLNEKLSLDIKLVRDFKAELAQGNEGLHGAHGIASIDEDDWAEQAEQLLQQTPERMCGQAELVRRGLTKLAPYKWGEYVRSVARPLPPGCNVLKGGTVKVRSIAVNAGLYWQHYRNSRFRVCYLPPHQNEFIQ